MAMLFKMMAMLTSMILGQLTKLLYSVTPIVLHLLALLILEETGLHQMVHCWVVLMFQDEQETMVTWL